LVLLLLTPREAHGSLLEGLSLLMQCLAREHVRFVNPRRSRVGTLWQGRFQAAPVEVASFGLTCWRFVEQAPIRCGVEAQALAYPWSSAGHYGGRTTHPWLVDHPLRWGLGNTPFDREAAHRALLDDPLLPSEVGRVESTALKGWALGSGSFLADLQTKVGRRLQPAARGRPRRPSAP
jgi:putative transposase